MSEPFNREIVVDMFQQVTEYLESARKSFETVPDVDFFRTSHPGKEKLASICMFLMAAGEQIKKIDQLTNGVLLSQYPNVDWKRVKTFRNIVAHDYVHIDSEIVFNICSNDIEPLLNTIKHIISDLDEAPC